MIKITTAIIALALCASALAADNDNTGNASRPRPRVSSQGLPKHGVIIGGANDYGPSTGSTASYTDTCKSPLVMGNAGTCVPPTCAAGQYFSATGCVSPPAPTQSYGGGYTNQGPMGVIYQGNYYLVYDSGGGNYNFGISYTQQVDPTQVFSSDGSNIVSWQMRPSYE